MIDLQLTEKIKKLLALTPTILLKMPMLPGFL